MMRSGRPFMVSAGSFEAAGVYRRAFATALRGLARRLAPRRAALWVALFAAAPSCQNLNLFTLDQDAELGKQSYDEILKGQKLVTSGPSYQMVNRIMQRLVEAAREESPDVVDKFTWEVNLIAEDQTVNAFALPGGKMAVYTGILPVAESEAGLAVVMGHEIGHVIERHGTEAMTKQYGTQVLIDILTEGTANQIAQIGNGLLQLHFGRGAELEADRRGLMYMARAGYDPREAVAFWGRMTQLGGGAPPEWLSTHPSHEHRIDQLESMMSDALPVYEKHRQ